MIKTLPLFLVAGVLVAAGATKIFGDDPGPARKMIKTPAAGTDGGERFCDVCVPYGNSGGGSGVAALVRSMTGSSLQTPHTGAMTYTAGVAKIPVAALSVEDAAMIERLVKGGSPVRVRLTMEAHQEPDADSHNVMGEIRGREKPD